jgi:uncharacterized protein (DUF488 family)
MPDTKTAVKESLICLTPLLEHLAAGPDGWSLVRTPPSTTIYTLGYGGRTPAELLSLLQNHGVTCVVDVRLRPDQASMGIYKKARDPEKGICGLLSRAGIKYVHLVELGNLFIEREKWQDDYYTLISYERDLMLRRLRKVVSQTKMACLLCAEKNPTECHRSIITRVLAEDLQFQVEHIL